MPLLTTDQRNDAWHQARKGKITASLAAACLGLDPHKGPYWAWQEIQGRHQQPVNRHMAWGTEFEPVARRWYEDEMGDIVEQTGFWVHKDYPWLGASPDGLIGGEGDGLLEVKVPTTIPSAVPPHHEIQCRVQMAVLDRNWVDYLAWGHEGHFLKRIERVNGDEGMILKDLEAFYLAYIVPNLAPPKRRKK